MVCPPKGTAELTLRSTRTGKLVQSSLVSQLALDWMQSETEDFEKRLMASAGVLPDRDSDCVLISSGEQESIQTHAWKLIRSKMGGVQLFVKPDDRWEVNDVRDLCPDITKKLIVLLDHYLDAKDPNLKVALPKELSHGLN